MTKLLYILILDDSASDAGLVARQIERAGYEVRWERVDTAPAFKAALEREAWDVVSCDYTMPDFNGLDALGIMRASGRDVPFIFVSGTIGEDVAVEAMKAGAHDYVMKGNLKRLLPAIERELREVGVRREHKRVEEALITSELRYRRLFEAARDGILILDAESGMIVYVNPFLVELLGFSREAFLGKKVWELGSFKDIVANQANFAELQKQEYIRYRDKPLQTAAGLRIDVEFVSNVYLVNHQRVIQCNIRDISARKNAEAKLHDSEERYRQITENVADLIAVLDPKGRRLYNNPSYRALVPDSDLQAGADSFLQIHPEDQERIRRIFSETVSTGVGQRTDYRLLASDGSVHYIESQGSVVRDGSGHVANVLVVSRDITERKHNEQQLRLAGAEVQRVNQSLVERNTEIQNFYHTLSHELKTPLTSAREFISILIDGLAGPVNETQLEYLGIAKESCDQLRLYINDLLDVTRLETGKMSIEFHPVALAALVEHVVNTLAPAAKGKNLRLSYDCQPDLPDVPLDRQRIAQVLTNLATNALKFTPAGGQIHISVSAPAATPEYLQVAVRDTGRGIPGDQLDLIFNRLHQAHRNDAIAESRSGLGLGLYICKELVQLHGGRIWAESELGQGSTFSFTIPRRQTPASHNVLVVDDDPLAIELVWARLEREHYHITSAGSGMEALEQMHRRLPDVVLMDLQMPDLDGAATMKEIRKVWDVIPVILHTAYTDSDQMMRALQESPFTVLAKPYDARRLLEAVHAAVASQEPHRGEGNPDRPLVSAREPQPSPGPAAEPRRRKANDLSPATSFEDTATCYEKDTGSR